MNLSSLRSFGIAILASVGLASAAPIISFNAGVLNAYRYVTPEGEIRDVRGLIAFDVSDPGPLGSVLLTDSTGGTDPNFQVLAFGNSALIGINSFATESTSHAFDLAGGMVEPASFIVKASGVSLVPGVTTDPALQRLLGTLIFTFNLVSITPDPGTQNFLVAYTFGGVTAEAIPEPATALLFLVGAIPIALKLRRRSKA